MGPRGNPAEILEIRPLRLQRKPKLERSDGEEWALIPGDPSDGADESPDGLAAGLSVVYGGGKERVVGPEPFHSVSMGRFLFFEGQPGAPSRSAFVPATGLSSGTAAAWWDSVSLTDAEERIVECLALIAPIQRLSFVESPTESGRIAVARIKGESEPVPLRSLGDGMRRMFHFALAMEAARETALLLIDEIENGIHYSVHKELWRFLIQSARRSGVQIFATTHSWDCVLGLRDALVELSDVEANLIRLHRRGGEVEVTVLDRAEMMIAARDGIEVR